MNASSSAVALTGRSAVDQVDHRGLRERGEQLVRGLGGERRRLSRPPLIPIAWRRA